MLMNAASLPYPGHQNLESEPLPGGGYRIAYRDISPSLVNYVSNITISKGHRLLSGFFGTGLLVSGFMDRVLGWSVTEAPNVTSAFGFLTSLILIFISISRNVTINQLMNILEQHIDDEGYGTLTHNKKLKGELKQLEKGKYSVEIPSPFLMLKGVELLPK